MMLTNFTFQLATRIEFGEGYLSHAGTEAKKLGITKAMLIADKGIIAAGIVKPIEESLNAEKVDYVIYDQIMPNPRDIHCIAGAEFAKEHGVDGMIAVGGGSSMDTAKAVGTLCACRRFGNLCECAFLRRSPYRKASRTEGGFPRPRWGV